MLPHTLLYLNLDDFNFNLAVMYFADLEEKKLQDKTEKSQNEFSEDKNSSNLTQQEFEQAFNVT